MTGQSEQELIDWIKAAGFSFYIMDRGNTYLVEELRFHVNVKSTSGTNYQFTQTGKTRQQALRRAQEKILKDIERYL